MYEDKFVRSFILCEALHAYGPVAEDLMEDEEFTEAKSFQDYLKCKMGWLNGAAEEGFACNQVNMREARTRLTSTWPAHGLLKMLGDEWHMDKLSGMLQYEVVAASCAIVSLASTVRFRSKWL
jgi:hypothetical protein